MLDWDSSRGYKTDKDSFLFSIANDMKFSKIQNQTVSSIYCNSEYGPTFGGNHDLYISSDSNYNLNSYANVGSSF
jgi:hypothetical protein